MDDLHQDPRPAAAELSGTDREVLEALAEDGHGLLPEGSDMERLSSLGLVTKLGITWGLTAEGRARLAQIG